MTTRSIVIAVVVCSALAVSLSAAQTGSTAKPAAPKPTTQKPAGTKPAGSKPAAAAKPAATSAALRTPSKLTEKAPESYKVNFETSAGVFVVEVTRAWAPRGADRFYNLVKNGYYDNGRFFRVVPKFMVQFGIYGDPKIQAGWADANIPDDPVTQSNKRGFITFAQTSAPNTRSTQVFINYKDNGFLDSQRFAPFGQVISGMEVVDKINPQYGEQPVQERIQLEGNAYLTNAFPRLDFVKKASIVK
jgi:cyclophilin family peptidyl-prolyl cis-trans isomerase